MNRGKLCLLTFGLALSACAPSTRGVVLMKLNDETIHISNGQTDVGVGETVNFLRGECGNSRALQCPLKSVGQGTVIKKLSDRYSEVALKSGSRVKEGDLVDTQSSSAN